VDRYLYVVVDDDGDIDATFNRREEAVEHASAWKGFKVFRFELSKNKRRKDGALYVSKKA